MMRLIDADALIDEIKYITGQDTIMLFDDSKTKRVQMVNMAAFIEVMPTIDPVRHGKWMAIGNTGLAACECGYVTDRYSIYNYCPNCGSKNGGEE